LTEPAVGALSLFLGLDLSPSLRSSLLCSVLEQAGVSAEALPDSRIPFEDLLERYGSVFHDPLFGIWLSRAMGAEFPSVPPHPLGALPKGSPLQGIPAAVAAELGLSWIPVRGWCSIELPALPFSHPRICTPLGLWNRSTAPLSLAVVGGGYLGCELAHAWACAGSQVVVVEAGPALLPGFDPDAAARVRSLLEAAGVGCMDSVRVTGFSDASDGSMLQLVGVPFPVEIAVVAVGLNPVFPCDP
jgi:hypothetical protein